MYYSDETIRKIRFAAGEGSPDAQYQLGVYYRDCTDGHRDVRKTIKWLWRSACQGAGHALKDLQDMAEHNDVEAQFFLGKMYAEGTGVDMNDKMACDYLKRASEGKYQTAALYYALYLKKTARENVINHQEDAEEIYKSLMFVYGDGKASDQCWLARLLGSEMYRYDSVRFRAVIIGLWIRAAEKHYAAAWHMLERAVTQEGKALETYKNLKEWERKNKKEPSQIAINQFKALLKQYKKRIIKR